MLELSDLQLLNKVERENEMTLIIGLYYFVSDIVRDNDEIQRALGSKLWK